MLRHFFISTDLDDLEQVETELETNGIDKAQIHVLSENDYELEKHHLHSVSPMLKRDIFHCLENGLVVGCILASFSLIIPYLMKWTETQAGWLPFIFLSVMLLGFSTWEGGLIGIQKTNVQFKRFQANLLSGKHILLVDLENTQEILFSKIIKKHPQLVPAGVEKSSPKWMINCQNMIFK